MSNLPDIDKVLQEYITAKNDYTYILRNYYGKYTLGEYKRVLASAKRLYLLNSFRLCVAIMSECIILEGQNVEP